MIRVPINGPTLRWARESMFMGTGELARAAGTSEARIEAFETGSAMPTLRQLRLIGKNSIEPSLSSSRRRPRSPTCPAPPISAATAETPFRLCWRGKCVGRSSTERPCWNWRGPRGRRPSSGTSTEETSKSGHARCVDCCAFLMTSCRKASVESSRWRTVQAAYVP